MPSIPPRLLLELQDVVGATHVLVDDDVTQRYRTDWTRRFVAGHAAVVRPGTTAEVASVVRACATYGVAIVPQGGNTGLVGGSVPLAGELVLSTDRLVEIDRSAQPNDLIAGAGAALVHIQRAAEEQGRQYGVDIASRESATIGGTIATNAGGLRVIRYGDTRRQLQGIEIVTGTGEILDSLGGTLRDNTGYHLPSIVAGSEGTLCIVTRARLRLALIPHTRWTALIGFDNVRDAAYAAESMRQYVPPVEAVEIFVASGLELVCRAFGLPQPLRKAVAAYLLVDFASDKETLVDVEAIVEALKGVSDVAVADHAMSRRRLWRYRELHTDAIGTVGVPHKLDVAVPPGSLAEFMDAVPRVVSIVAPGANTWLFGHGGESSIHVNVTGPPNADFAVDEAVLKLVAVMDGSISAEHGIGRAKLPWITLTRSAEHLTVLAGVKAAFDPHGILNPGVVLPSGASTARSVIAPSPCGGDAEGQTQLQG